MVKERQGVWTCPGLRRLAVHWGGGAGGGVLCLARLLLSRGWACVWGVEGPCKDPHLQPSWNEGIPGARLARVQSLSPEGFGWGLQLPRGARVIEGSMCLTAPGQVSQVGNPCPWLGWENTGQVG